MNAVLTARRGREVLKPVLRLAFCRAAEHDVVVASAAAAHAVGGMVIPAVVVVVVMASVVVEARFDDGEDWETAEEAEKLGRDVNILATVHRNVFVLQILLLSRSLHQKSPVLGQGKALHHFCGSTAPY